MATRRDDLLSRLKNNLAFASKATGVNASSVNIPNRSAAPPERTTIAPEEAVNGSNAQRQYPSRSPQYFEDNHQLIMADARNSRVNSSEQSDVDILRRLDDRSSRSMYPQRPVPGEQKSDNFMQSVMSFLSPQYRPAESVGGQNNRNVSPEYDTMTTTMHAQQIPTSRIKSPPEMDNYSAAKRDASKLNIDNYDHDTAQRSALPDVTFANNPRSVGSSRINIMRPSGNVSGNQLSDAPNRSLDRLDRGFDSSSRNNNPNVSTFSSSTIDSRQNESIRRPISPESSWPEREARVVVKSQLSNDEREQMVSAMEEMHSNVTMLDEALTNLKQMRERMLDRPSDGQRDTLLRENSRMQEEINSQLSALRQAAKEIADELLEDVAKLVTARRSSTSPVRDVGRPTLHQSYTRSITGNAQQQLADLVASRHPLNTHTTLPDRLPQRDQLPSTNLSNPDASVNQLSYIDNGSNQKSYAEDALPRRSYADDLSREFRTEKVNLAPTKQHDSDLDDFAIDAAMQQSNLIFAAMNQHKKQQPQEGDRDQRNTTLDKQIAGKGNSQLRLSRENSPYNNTTDERRSRSAAREALYGRKSSRGRSTEKRNNKKNNRRFASKTRKQSKRSRSRVRSVSSSSTTSAKSSSRDRLKRRKRNRSDSRGSRDRSRNRSAARDRSRRKDTSKSRGRDRSRSRKRSVSRDRARSSSRGRVRDNSRSRSSRNRSSGRRDSRSKLREKAPKQRSKSQLRADKEKAEAKAKADFEEEVLRLKEEKERAAVDKERAALEMIVTLYMNAESYYDAGNLWCKKCCCILVDLPDLCKHLHSEDHLRKTDPNFDVKRPAVVEKITGAMAPARGDEFLLPMVSFFCSLCCDFSKDRNQAEAHIKSVEHNDKFKEFLKENSGYELQFLKEKSSALLAHDEKKNVICIDTPPNNNDTSKDTGTSKASDKFQIKFTGSLKQVPKKLVKNKPLALDDKDDDDDIDETEEPTDGITRKTKPADLKMNVIPLPATSGSLTGNNRQSVTTSSVSSMSFKLSSTTGTKVLASSAKSLTTPKSKFAGAPVALYRPSPTREAHESTAEGSSNKLVELKKSIKSGLLASHVLFSIPQDEDLHTSLTSSGSNDSGWQLSALRTPTAVAQLRGVNKSPAWTLLPPPSLSKVNRAPALRINAVSAAAALNKPTVAHISNFMPPPRMS